MSKFRTPFPYNEPVRNYRPKSPETIALKAEYDRQKSEKTNVPLVIAGEHIFDRPSEPIAPPHDHRNPIADLVIANRQDIERAIESCVAAQKDWALMSWQDRSAVFLKAADLLATTYRDQIVAATMLGQSKTCHQAEIDAACELIDFLRFNVYFAEQVHEQQPLHSPAGLWNRTEARGLEGFVFAVGPFNFTAISANLAAAPALMGCSVLWKPAPAALISSYYMMRIFEQAGLPPGVINLVHGDPQVIGDAALNHPELSGIHFTGSTKTFNHLWQESAKNLPKYRSYPRIVGETGGKDFVFVHPSADSSQVVCGLIRGAFEYQGQKCSAASRAYIPASLWPEIKEKLIQEASTIKVGSPGDFKNFMAAVVNKPAFEKITGYINHAKTSSEAEIICGGQFDSSEGYFVWPTIIQTEDPNYQSMTEEIFGPVLTVFVYSDHEIDQTLTICDTSTPYALTGAIYARDRAAVADLTRRLTFSAGNFYINDKPTGAVVGQQPFGGGRRSGTNDKAGSMLNLLRWTSVRTIKENNLELTDYRYPFLGEGT